MIFFKILKPVDDEDLQKTGVKTPEEFAQWYADFMSKETGCPITATYQGEMKFVGGIGSPVDYGVHLKVKEADEEKLIAALDARGLSYVFGSCIKILATMQNDRELVDVLLYAVNGIDAAQQLEKMERFRGWRQVRSGDPDHHIRLSETLVDLTQE